MTIICNTIHGLDDFSYNADTRCFIAEASTLSKGRRIRCTSQVFDDACDEGFVIRSHYTGREFLFIQDGVDKDREGDVAGWRFKAHKMRERNARWVASDRDFTALIIND